MESRAPGRRRLPDVPGAVVLAAAVGALTLGVVKGPEWGSRDAGVLAAFVGAAAGLAVVGRRCRWHPQPVLDSSLLRIRAFAVANVLTLVGAAGFFAYTLGNVLFLTTVWGYSVLEAGLALTPGPSVAAAIAGPASRVAGSLGHRPVLAVGGLLWGGRRALSRDGGGHAA